MFCALVLLAAIPRPGDAFERSFRGSRAASNQQTMGPGDGPSILDDLGSFFMGGRSSSASGGAGGSSDQHEAMASQSRMRVSSLRCLSCCASCFETGPQRVVQESTGVACSRVAVCSTPCGRLARAGRGVEFWNTSSGGCAIDGSGGGKRCGWESPADAWEWCEASRESQRCGCWLPTPRHDRSSVRGG